MVLQEWELMELGETHNDDTFNYRHLKGDRETGVILMYIQLERGVDF